MKITKTSVKSYDIYDAIEWEFTFGETMETRKKAFGNKNDKYLEKCFICGHKFQESEIPWLGFVKNDKNVFLCKECGKKVTE